MLMEQPHVVFDKVKKKKNKNLNIDLIKCDDTF